MKKMDTNQVDNGKLQVQVSSLPQNHPIDQASVSISYTGDPQNILEELTTDNNGRTPVVELPAPPIDYSMAPNENQTYSEYTIKVNASGHEPVEISGCQLLPDSTAIQPVQLNPETPENPFMDIAIAAHTLYYEYPPKIPEDEIKPVDETGEIVLSRVVIPEFVVVHDGAPGDPTAANYYERYRDYIKNVASSEIYATWPDATIRANILAIMSFTLNRVYTEWYRNKGNDFTITSSTAYDHKWIHGRNYFDSISQIVDEMFSNYLSRPNVRQPILTQYCDGNRVTCPNWMAQWGSKYLGDQGYSTIQILRNYYGQDMYINTAEELSGVPASWPGYNLDIGASGPKVSQIQDQLNAIAAVYSSIPTTNQDGTFTENTQHTVQAFQSLFGLPASGIIDYPTWYKIQDIYVAVTRIAELT